MAALEQASGATLEHLKKEGGGARGEGEEGDCPSDISVGDEAAPVRWSSKESTPAASSSKEGNDPLQQQGRQLPTPARKVITHSSKEGNDPLQQGR